MKKTKWVLGLLAYMLIAAAAMVQPSLAQDTPAMVIGRVYHVEGDLFRYVPDEKDWVAVVRDAPFGAEDTLFSGSRGMAELIVPNGSWIRVGNSTQIQFMALDTDLSETDVASGVARFYNKSSDTVIKATSPFGYVLSYPGTVFDFYVGENSVEVVAVRGKVSFVHAATEAKYDVAAGYPSILADQQQVSSGEGTVDPEWDRWNAVRESFWAAKARVRGRSAEYLPPSLRDESYALEENGRWERVRYEGAERWFWRPTAVAENWSPFSVGRWTDWYGDQTWIPAEPFGYVTHHYGNWIYARNYWYWAPPVVSIRVGLPLLNLGFFWYPGRVSWIHSGAYVGWVPLAPRETYYSRRPWGGPHDVVVTNVNVRQISINVRNYAYANRAIIVNQNNFYGVNNYKNVRVTNINSATIINNYQAAPIVNNTVINNYTTNRQRYNYSNVPVNEKPHNTVINRIQQNETHIEKGKKESATMLEQQVKSIKLGEVNREARIEQPKATNYIVPVNEVNRPKSETRFQQREVKAREGAALGVRPEAAGKPEQQPARSEQPKPERVAPARPVPQPQAAQPAQPSAKPERVGPTKPEGPAPARPQPPVAKPEREAPAKPTRQPEAAGKPEQQPARSEQPKPERVAPARPVPQPQAAQPAQPSAKPERVGPTKPEGPAPARPQPPVAKPEREAPAKPTRQPEAAGKPEQQPARSEQPKPERVAPARPVPQPQAAQPAQPSAKPERVGPTKPEGPAPARPQPPVAKPEREAPAKPGSEQQPRDEPGQQERPR